MIKTTPLRVVIGGCAVCFLGILIFWGILSGNQSLVRLVQNCILLLFALAFALGIIFGPSDDGEDTLWKSIWQKGFNYNTVSAWAMGLFAAVKSDERDIDRRMAARRARVAATKKKAAGEANGSKAEQTGK